MIPFFCNGHSISRNDREYFGIRFIQSKHARPYRHKSRKALTNFRIGNKKKLRQFAK